jgi:hypothetical protein
MPYRDNQTPVPYRPAQRSGGLLDAIGARFDAWVTEIETNAELALLECERKLDAKRHEIAYTRQEARYRMAELSLEAQSRLARLSIDAEDATWELNMRRAVRALPPASARQLIAEAIETEKSLLELARLRQQRLSGAPGLPPAPPALPVPALEPYIGDQQIEEVALSALARIGTGTPQAEAQWRQFEADVRTGFPPYVAAEVIERAREMRGLAGKG